MLTIFPLEQVNDLRFNARRAGEVSDTGPEGWSRSDTDPMELLAVFTSLRLKPDYTLRAYQYRSCGNGNGVVWAMKSDAPFPEPKDCQMHAGGILRPPKPPGAIDFFMEAIEGDGTPWSWLSASLFARVALEFGAIWHGCGWSDYRILGADPWGSHVGEWSEDVKALGDRIASLTLAQTVRLNAYLRNVHRLRPTANFPWRWLAPRPDLWSPSCRQEEDATTVVFYTFTRHVREVIHCFRDRYPPGQYNARCEVQAIAEGGPGYIH